MIKAVFVLASNHFRKYFSVNAGVWLRMENKFSGKYFQLTVCFNGFDPEIGFSQNFHFKPFLDSHAKRERESLSTSTSTPTKPRSRLTSVKLRPAQPSFDYAGPLPRSCVGQTPKTHKHRSTQISAHPSLITNPPLRSPAMH